LFEHPSTILVALIAFLGFGKVIVALSRRGNQDKTGNLSPTVWIIVTATAYAAGAISSAAGVLIGPAILVVYVLLCLRSKVFPLAVCVRAGAAVLVVIALVSGTYIASYYSASGEFQSKPIHILAAGRFTLLFIGGAFFRDSDWPVGVHPNPFLVYLVSVVFWLLLIWLAIRLFRRLESPRVFEIFHASAIVFIILTAAVGGLFRADLSPLEAINKKYAPDALLAWASVASLLLYIRPRTIFGRSASSWMRPLLICSGVVALLIPGNLTELRVWQDWERQIGEAATTSASGVYSRNLLNRFFWNDDEAFQVVRQFIRDRKYCYRRMPPPGYLLRERFNVTSGPPASLKAQIEYLDERSGMDGFIATGTNSSLRAAAVPSLVIADSGGRVIGYGSVSNIGPGGRPTGAANVWFAAFRSPLSPSTGIIRIYEIHENTARLAGEIAEPNTPVANFTANVPQVALARVLDHTDYGLEHFNGVGTPLIKPPVRVRVGEDISLTGWAVDRDAGTSVAALEFRIDRQAFPGQAVLYRPDVATFFKRPGFASSGFSFRLPASRIGVGSHELRLRIYTNGGKSYLESRVYPFFVD
jgi:hypothetical protein